MYLTGCLSSLANDVDVVSSLDATSQAVLYNEKFALVREFGQEFAKDFGYSYKLVRIKQLREPDEAFQTGLEVDEIIMKSVIFVKESDGVIVFSGAGGDGLTLELAKGVVKRGEEAGGDKGLSADLYFSKMLVFRMWEAQGKR